MKKTIFTLATLFLGSFLLFYPQTSRAVSCNCKITKDTNTIKDYGCKNLEEIIGQPIENCDQLETAIKNQGFDILGSVDDIALLYSGTLNCAAYSDSSCTVPATTANALENLKVDLNARKPLLEINIPGINFSDVKTSKDETGTYVYIAWIPELISALYKFGLGIISIVAAVIIIIQGLRVVTSGGGEAKTDAYKKILQSVVGLFIAWGSYAILYNVNPALVQFNALKVKTVERMELEETHNCDDPDPKVCGRTNTIPPTSITHGVNKTGLKTDLDLAKVNRTAPIQFDYFGKIDFIIASAYGKRDLKSITRIIVHNGGSPSVNVDTWTDNFNKGGFGTGTQYTIARDGGIYQMVNDEYLTWHANALSVNSVGVEMQIQIIGGKSCNSMSAKDPKMIEACSLTDAQYTALNLLIDDLAARTSIKKDAGHIFGHCEAPTATHGDPKAFDWTRIINTTNQAIKDRVPSGHCEGYLPL